MSYEVAQYLDANGKMVEVSAANPLPTTAVITGDVSAVPTGTAGTPNAAVISVQGVSGGTAQPVSTADITATGTITAAQPAIGTPVAGGTVSLTLGKGQGAWIAVISGTFSAGSTIVVDESEDGTTWFASTFNSSTAAGPPVSSQAGGAAVLLKGTASAKQYVRVRCSVLYAGDSIGVGIWASVAAWATDNVARETGGNLAALVAGVNVYSGASVALSAPPAALTASADTTFTFSSKVHHVEIQNNSSTAVGIEYDAAATAGSWQIPPNGGALLVDHPVTAVHLFSTAATNVNGTGGSNIVLKGWL